ncbi:uncharacterized protein LOC142983468 [Anticarsia gemmatalis]|uniref:uncharacterized protein LOC142983468 n=1 Tax=Anticarsia gemmatalis TaxID=129554 RepID=UPI003F76E5B2
MKYLCSSIFGGPCNEKTCPRHAGKSEDANLSAGTQTPFKRCSVDHKDLKSVAQLSEKEKSKCNEIEMAKIKEIERHIERERQIQNELLQEQTRHKLRQLEISKELDQEVLRHKEKESALMCDDDTQTNYNSANIGTSAKLDLDAK